MEQQIKELEFGPTPKQEALLFQVLKSGFIPKKTRDTVTSILKKNKLSRKDYGEIITYVLIEKHIREKFLGKKFRSKAKCCFCDNVFFLERKQILGTKCYRWICGDCLAAERAH